MNRPEFPDLDAYRGKERVEEETLSLGQAKGLAAMLDRDAESLKDGAVLPAGWHWIYFKSTVGSSALGADGHADRFTCAWQEAQRTSLRRRAEF